MIKKNKDIDKDGLNEIIHLSKNLLRLFYIILIVGIFLGILIALKQLKLFSVIMGILKVISPLFIGFVISWLSYPLHKKMLDKGLNKVISALIIFLMIIGIVLLFIYIFIPVIYNQVNDLISNIPTILSSISDFFANHFNKLDIKGIDIDSIKNGLLTATEDYIINFTSNLPNNIINLVKGLFSALGIILLSLIISIYMLIDYDNITVRFHCILPKKYRNDLISLLNNISSEAHKVVNGTLLIALMVFICDTIGFALVGLDMAILFGLLCGFTDLIPYVGPYIGGTAAVIVAFTQSPMIGIGVLIIAIIVQMLENYVIQPMVMSQAMQMNPIIIIVGLLLFGYFFGIIGMIVATPCMAIIKEIILFIYNKRKEKKVVGERI